MESQKLSKLLNKARDSTLVTKKWNIVKDPLYANCAVWNEIIYSKEVLKSNSFSFNDVYILVGDYITISGRDGATRVTFKKFAPFTKSITKLMKQR